MRLCRSQIMDLNQTLSLLTSKSKLERDKSLKSFETALSSLSENDIKAACDFVAGNIFGNISQPLEVEHGSLGAAKSIVVTCFEKLPPGFALSCEQACFRLMSDKEYRVRDLSSEVIGILASKVGTEFYERNQPAVLTNIRDLLVSNPDESFEHESDCSEANNRRHGRCSSPSPTRDYNDGCVEGEVTTERPHSPGFDTESLRKMTRELDKWKALEVWTKCLFCIIEGLGVTRFKSFVDQSFLELVFQTLEHKDRYVRESGFQIIASLLSVQDSLTRELHDQIAPRLRAGLADNWSHVRMQACVATRNFFLHISGGEARERFYPILLPALCLNRYHLAEGVRIYSQETWKLITNGEGKALVEKHIFAVVDFYIEQCEAKNHAVREASINCIAEMAVKMEKAKVSAHVPRLLETLIVCFEDDSWPVRDGACQACAKFIAAFPDESLPSIDNIMSLIAVNLKDNIASVRSGAASAFGLIAKTYGGKVKESIVENYLFPGLQAVNDQPDEAHRLAHGTGGLRLVANEQDGDAISTHLRRFNRPAEPWEITDGAIFLFVELSPCLTQSELSKAIELILHATSRRDYAQHSHLLATLCKQLPELAKRIGKQAFKAHLEQFFEPLFYCIDQQHMALVAGENCIIQLCQLIGPSVFRGRVQNHNPAFLKMLDRLVPPTY